ncbi:MAG: helix-turn-helix domain-containing protein [Halioglobus sp.]|nr:helix-turn-helix domain-containing protein [Halioglobus sp.]
MTERAAEPAGVSTNAPLSPGALLQAEREAQGMAQREADARLKLTPGYVAILERDDYQALRSPAFARGYVKAYGRLLGLNENELLGAFDHLRETRQPPLQRPDPRVRSRPLQLQRTGRGVIIGLLTLLVLVLALWWWQGGAGRVQPAQVGPSAGQPAPTNATGER